MEEAERIHDDRAFKYCSNMGEGVGLGAQNQRTRSKTNSLGRTIHQENIRKIREQAKKNLDSPPDHPSVTG